MHLQLTVAAVQTESIGMPRSQFHVCPGFGIMLQFFQELQQNQNKKLIRNLGNLPKAMIKDFLPTQCIGNVFLWGPSVVALVIFLEIRSLSTRPSTKPEGDPAKAKREQIINLDTISFDT
jgi:hypothetical protein